MAKQRYVRTSFWTDTFIENLDPSEKLVFLYLLTNESTNLCWIYEISIKRIAFETWYDKDMIEKILDRFTKSDKLLYIDWYVCINNYTKHQVINPSTMEWIKREMEELNVLIKSKLETVPSLWSGWSTLLNLTKPNLTKPNLTEEINIKFDIFRDLYNKKVWDKNRCEKKWNSLKNEERENIIDFIPRFTKTISDKQFQPYPETFLNQRRWENELVKPWTPVKTPKEKPEFIWDPEVVLTDEEKQKRIQDLKNLKQWFIKKVVL